jgi:hypothetical protein
MNTHNGGNHEPIQQFDEVVSIQQQWCSTTPRYFIPITCVPAPIIICWFTKSITKPKHGFGTIDSKNGFDISIGLNSFIASTSFSNQSVSIPHLEHVEVQATPLVVRQKITYQLVMWPN